MTDRIVTVGGDGKLPDDISGNSLAEGGGAVSITPEGAVSITSAVDPDSPVWIPRRSYGGIDLETTPVPVIVEGGVETDGIFVASGPRSARTWASHVFHGWDETHTWRLTMGIDEFNDPSVAFIQTWNPATNDFGRLQVGSDYNGQGTFFDRYDIVSNGHLTFSGAFEGRNNTVIARTGSSGSITIRGGYNGNPTKGSFIQVRGASQDTNPAGTVVNFGCTWLSEAALAESSIAFNLVSSTRNVDLARILPTGELELLTGDLRIATPKTPASATATGRAGELCWDEDYLYVCTATDTWKRAALTTWP